jgi:hypothetical protein
VGAIGSLEDFEKGKMSCLHRVSNGGPSSPYSSHYTKYASQVRTKFWKKPAASIFMTSSLKIEVVVVFSPKRRMCIRLTGVTFSKN